MREYTIAIDLGEKSVIAIAGYVDEHKQICVEAIATRETRGVKSGRIENIAQVNESLSGVIAELEGRLGVEIQHAYAGISGEYVRCEHHNDRVAISEPNNGVGSIDLAALNSIMRGVLAPATDTIMEYSPQNYTVDDCAEEANPVGRFGHSIGSTFNFVLCEQEALKRLSQAFRQAGIELKKCYPNALAAAEAVLTADEMKAGVALVDLGEGVTNVAIYCNNSLRKMASIPMGGSAINNDIRSLMILERTIEKLKREKGSAVADPKDESKIEVIGRTQRDNKSIPLYNLSTVIQERVTDIIVYVNREIREAGFTGLLPYGIVLTGGGANLRNIAELFARNLEMDVRVAYPEEGITESSMEMVDAPEFATVMGLLKRGIESDRRSVGQRCTVAIEAPKEPAKEEEVVEKVEETIEERVEIEEPTEAHQTALELEVEEPKSEKSKKKEEKKRGLWGKITDGLNDLFNGSGSEKEL